MTTTAADRSMLGYALAHDEGEAFWLAPAIAKRHGVIILGPPGPPPGR